MKKLLLFLIIFCSSFSSIKAQYCACCTGCVESFGLNCDGLCGPDNNCGSAAGYPNLAACQAALPVELLNFSATPKDETILLEWNTATETNNKGFELQRSPDGQQWQTITFVKGHGNKITPSHYNYIDQPNASGTFYYRLQQIDFDGAIDFSNIVSAKLSLLLDEIIVFPNPVGIKDLTIQFPNKGNYQVKLFNAYGKLLLHNNMIVNEKAEQKQLSLSNWQSGIYLLEITTAGEQFTQVLIKQRE